MILRSVAAAAAVVLLASAAMAKPVTPDEAAQFQTGTATYDDVVAKLGRPNTVTTNSDGSTEIEYVSTRTHVKAATFVPYVGLFAGGAKGSATKVKFTFGPDHVLKSVTTSETSLSCNSFGKCGS